MPRFKLSEDYYHRKCYFERDQVPTQTVMRNKMRQLAPVYFKSMTYKLKVFAGLEPPLKGGGADWFQPPSEILKGRHVLQPVEHDHLTKLSYNGINLFGVQVAMAHMKSMEYERIQALAENDAHWRRVIAQTCARQSEETASALTKRNTERILKTFHEYTYAYVASMSKLEKMLQDAAEKEIKTFEEMTRKKMMERYRIMLKYQATELYEKYIALLDAKKAELKAKFLEDLYELHKERTEVIHDINVEKHIAVEKLRKLLECQKLAAQIYVAQKEREECKKEINLTKDEFQKTVKKMNDRIAFQNFEIKLETEQETKRQKFNAEWKQKICQVVKKFQLFVEYCFNLVPQYAEFFINIEKLMMIQLMEASENPSAESIIEPDEPELKTPDAHPHPYFFFREGGYYPKLHDNLCPKHCTSSASQLPVVVFGKRCMYAACDNLEQFAEKAIKYIMKAYSDDDPDIQDFHDYSINLPVKVTESCELQEIKLQGSLMRILQQERANVNEVPTACCLCDIPHCFCSPQHASQLSIVVPSPKLPSVHSLPSGSKIETRDIELKHHREPKWESYIEFTRTKKCLCSKTAKKHLTEHLPPYMRTRSKFEEAEIPNYEPCSVRELKQMVRKAKGKRSPPLPPVIQPLRYKDACTQYEDLEFQQLCDCLMEDDIAKLFKGKRFYEGVRLSKLDTTDGAVSSSYLEQSTSQFAIKQAFNLRTILDDDPQLQEIFKSRNKSPK